MLEIECARLSHPCAHVVNVVLTVEVDIMKTSLSCIRKVSPRKFPLQSTQARLSAMETPTFIKA